MVSSVPPDFPLSTIEEPFGVGLRVFNARSKAEHFENFSLSCTTNLDSRDTFLSPFLQSQRHGILERIDIGIVLDDLCEKILRLLFPIGKSLQGVSRPRLILSDAGQ